MKALNTPPDRIGVGLSSVEPEIHKTFTIYPNPAFEILYIKTNNKIVDQDKVVIYNLQGTKIEEIMIYNNDVAVPVATLTNGLYIVVYESQGVVIATDKLIIEK